MNKRKPVVRKLKRSFKTLSAVKKEVEQLRDWAQRDVEVEFVLPLAGGSIKYLGRIIDTTFSDEIVAGFDFISPSGVHASLLPQGFGKCSIEKIEGTHNGIYVEGKTKGSQGFSIVESLFDKKPHIKLPSVLEKLRTWERLQLDLHVFLNRGGHAISLLGQVRELSSGLFSFKTEGVPAQLMIRVDKYRSMTLKSDGEKSSVTLIDPFSEDMCVISDAATQPETLFKRYVDISSAVH
jgi:hypothetical protein